MAPASGPILVTGATGKTGLHLAAQLTERGLPVRALVHDDRKADRLAPLGVEVLTGDFFDLASLRRALAGVTRAYFCFPPADCLLEASVNFALAGRELGLETLVNVSQLHVRDGHPSALTRQHWLAEHVFDWALPGTAHLRCSFFAETYLIAASGTIAREGRFYLAYGNGRHAPVACEDVARVAAGILQGPTLRGSQRYEVTGPKALSQEEVAATFSRVLKRSVTYVDVPGAAWSAGAAELGMSPFLIEHLTLAAEDLKHGAFDRVTDVVKQVGGSDPRSFEEFITTHAPAFAQAS
jgi:NAD(P)H dehydrogenase (quinone)